MRLERVEEFLGALEPGTEVLLVGAYRDAVDDLVRRLTRQRPATFGLHRFSFGQLVGRLATGALAAERLAPSTSLGREAIAANIAFDAAEKGATPRLAPVTACPGFPRALAATLADLRLAGVPASAVAEADPDLGHLLEAYEEACARVGVADRADLLALATQSVGNDIEGLTQLPLVLLDVPVVHRAEREFVETLVRAAPKAILTVPRGDVATLASLKGLVDSPDELEDQGEQGLSRLRRYLFEDTAAPAASPDDTVHFFSAPGEGRECVEIAREIVRASRQGVRFDEMAVLLRAPESYSGLLSTALRRADVPAWFARGVRRPDPAGRAFLALLACACEQLSARRFAEYLAFAQVPFLDEGAPPVDRPQWAPPREETLIVSDAVGQLSLAFDVPPEPEPNDQPDDDAQPHLAGSLRAPWKWEEFLVEAAVIGQASRWRRRLSGLKSETKLRLQELTRRDPEALQVAALERDLQNLAHLEAFALPVIDILDAFPASAPWGVWLEHLARLAPMTLRRPERVLSVLAEMQPMAKVGPVTIDEVRSVLAPRLSDLQEEPPLHRFGHVFVGSPDQARGRSFRWVFVPGLAERVFPRRLREDPLLHDSTRRRVHEQLMVRDDRAQQERVLLRLSVGAATERLVLSYPRVELREGRPRVPSFYGLDIERALAGRIPDADEFARDKAAAADARLAWPAPADANDAIDAPEHDLATLGPMLRAGSVDYHGRARYLLELNPAMARSLRTRWLRWRRKWSEADGMVGIDDITGPILAEQSLKQRSFSPTSLQHYAACPYRFFLSAIHRLRPREEPVAVVRMDPLTRGSLVHEVQARFLRDSQTRGKLPIDPSQLGEAVDRLDFVLATVAKEYSELLAPAITRVWDDEVETLRADLRVWLRMLSDESHQWTPLRFEYAFGLAPNAEHDPHSRVEPVELAGGWKLRGAIDMVEESRDGESLRVTDHKTGKNRWKRGTVVAGGEVLQPVLYGLALEEALGKPVTLGRLWFCTSRGGFTELPIDINAWSKLYANKVLAQVDQSIVGGVLPPAPRKDACRYCDFRAVCGPNEEQRILRKDPALIDGLLELRKDP